MATIAVGVRLLLAAVFVTAAVGKLLDPQGSRQAVADFGVPPATARLVGLLLPLAELAAGVALIFPASARAGAIVALALLLVFIGGIARALSRGEQPDCHCFGQIHSAPAGRPALLRNVVLAAGAAVIVAYGSGPAVDTWVGARSAAELVAVGVGICAVAIAAYATSLRSKLQRVTRDLQSARQLASMGLSGLPPGVDAPPFALKDLRGETVTLDALRQRGHPVLLLFMSPSCGPCAAFVPRVKTWQQSLSERLTVAILSMGTAEENAPYSDEGLENVLLQEEGTTVAELYRVKGTPTGILLTATGKVASNPAEMAQAIEPLVRLALRDGVGRSLEPSLSLEPSVA